MLDDYPKFHSRSILKGDEPKYPKEEWQARKRCGEVPFEDEFLNASINESKKISRHFFWQTIICLVIGFVMILGIVGLFFYDWHILSCFEKCDFIFKNVNTIILK